MFVVWCKACDHFADLVPLMPLFLAPDPHSHSLHAPQVTKNTTTILFHTEVFAEQLFEADEEEEEAEIESREERDEQIRTEYKQKAHRIMKREKR